MELGSKNYDIPFYDVNCDRCRIKIAKFLIQNKEMFDDNLWLDNYVSIHIENNKIIFKKMLKMDSVTIQQI